MSASRQRRIDLSQNFLCNPRLVRRLVRNSGLGADDLVIEIGPGDGAITSALIESCRHVIAVEKDPRQAERLGRRFPNEGRLTLFAADFLEFPLPHTPYKVFASIPYIATAAIVGKLTSGIAPPDDAWLVIQREAALRFLGVPSGTLVAAQLHPWFVVSVEHAFRRTDFRPAPAVESVLLRIERRVEPLLVISARDRYLDFVVTIFTAWKPTVREAARSTLPAEACRDLERELGSVLDRKPSEVEPGYWVEAFHVLDGIGDDRVWRAFAGAKDRLERNQAALDKRRRTTVATAPSRDRQRPGDR